MDHQQKPPVLALFDFDGTLTTRDSMLVFLRFIAGNGRWLGGLIWLSPILVLTALGLFSKDQAKIRLLTYFLQGKEQKKLEQQAQIFCAEKLPAILRSSCLKRLQQLQKESARIVIVSASCDLWLTPWAQQQGVELLCSVLEIQQGIYTGKLRGKNCNREEKVQRIQASLDLNAYQHILAFGDSQGDLPMLSLAHEAWIKEKKFP